MSLRIASAGEESRRRSGPGASADYYLDRLVKLIPAEAVAAYPFLHSRAVEVAKIVCASNTAAISPDATAATGAAAAGATTTTDAFLHCIPSLDDANWLPAGVAWLIMIMVILLRWQATRGEHGEAQWGAVLIAAISFLLWVPVLDGLNGVSIPGDAGPAGSFGIFRTMTDLGIIHWHPQVQKFIPELLLVLWTILVPAFYRPAR